jgi:translation elongation factor EF-Ts
MHIAADSPLYVRRDLVPPDVLAKELQILMDAARAEQEARTASSKPHHGEVMLAKIAEGRINKWLNSVVLEEQAMLLSDADISNNGKPLTVAAWLSQVDPVLELGPFARLAIGS